MYRNVLRNQIDFTDSDTIPSKVEHSFKRQVAINEENEQ